MRHRRTFVRALWGDTDRAFSRVENKLWRDIKTTTREYLRPEPMLTLCWGARNSEFLRSIEVPHILVSSEPFPNWWQADGPRDDAQIEAAPDRPKNPKLWKAEWSGERYRRTWGRCHLRTKIECLRIALENHEAAIFLDLDTHLLRPLPADFWDRMAQGRALQCALHQYITRRVHIPHRDRLPGGKFLPSAAFIYCRSRSIIRRALQLHDRRPLESEEQVLARVFDEMNGGFKGPLSHYANGFAPSCFAVTRAPCIPPRRSIYFAAHCERAERFLRRGKVRGLRTPKQFERFAWPEQKPLLAPKIVRRPAPLPTIEAPAPVKARVRFIRVHRLNGRAVPTGTAENLRPALAARLAKMGIVEPLRHRDRELLKEAA